MPKAIEAITVCIDYADFLAETCTHNLPHFDRWLIVTSPADEKTRALCRERNLEVLLTDDHRRGGRQFDKARIIDRGLQLLTHRDWVLHLDADIVLPPHARQTLDAAELDPRCLYGWDRVMVHSRERWETLKREFLPRWSRSHHYNVCFPGNHDIGARWADPHHGYVPIGFSQLWHGPSTMDQGIRFRRYSNHGHNDAARTDVQFALQWDRPYRVLLPELVCLHLESVRGKPGANWQGRTTPPFRVS